MVFPEYFPLLDVYRSDYIDNRFFGLAFLFNKNGLVQKIGNDSFVKFYLRSMVKPVQASILTKEIIEEFNFNEMELAVMQASHAGQKIHIELIYSILNKIGLNENALLCPIIAPLNTKGILKYNKLHNNCSGKHSMMLAYCVYNGLDIKNYTDFLHPIQAAIRKKILDYAKTSDYIETKDGCTVPCIGLDIESIARCFLNYYEDKDNEILINAYWKNPEIIGGMDNFGKRSDTKIMELSSNLLSKVGAGGFIYVYNIKTEEILIVKMAQNNNPEREIVVLDILYKLNWLDKKYYDEKIYTEDNEPIGHYVVNAF